MQSDQMNNGCTCPCFHENVVCQSESMEENVEPLDLTSSWTPFSNSNVNQRLPLQLGGSSDYFSLKMNKIDISGKSWKAVCWGYDECGHSTMQIFFALSHYFSISRWPWHSLVKFIDFSMMSKHPGPEALKKAPNQDAPSTKLQRREDVPSLCRDNVLRTYRIKVECFGRSTERHV